MCNDNPKVDDAVGVPKRQWFVAIVNNKSEKVCNDKLKKLGYESYVPIQKESHRWRTGAIKSIDRIVLPAILFVYVTEQERKNEIVRLPFIKRFMTDKAARKDTFNRNPVAVIPDREIEQLRFMLDNSDTPVNIEAKPLHLGDMVRIIKGKLMGLEGNILRYNDGDEYIIVQLTLFGCARMKISALNVTRI